ncbi:MAG TPA: hypothetical protein VK879_18525 [Candidatus Sulfomarinibacteraceae bacterium]|nr:hypothetical protein [Candidatus Sulfomarinibacteraceae bacterium]
MNGRTLSLVIGVLVLLALAVGAAGAIPHRPPPLPSAASGAVSDGLSYQGRLTDAAGAPLDGTYTMRFIIYDDPVGGAAVWDSGNVSVAVEAGLFTTTLDVDQDAFDGQALWLSIVVEGQMLSPRQELLPAPYALGLRPGADIVGDSIAPGDAVLAGRAPATGTALQAQAAGGVGLFAASEDNVGVWGTSENGWGGYFTSDEGYGIRVDTQGADHFDHGVYVTATGGYGVYAQSAQNQAVRGEAGNVTGIAQPLGAVGVVGIGQNRGVYGASGSGVGVYGRTDNNYAGYFQSNNYRGLYARSASGYYAGYFTNQGGSTQPGMYVNGTLTVTGSKTGYVVDVCLNEGPESLEVGDVVAVVGVGDPVVGEIPVMRVVKATAENASAVVGVVDQRFLVDEENGESIARPDTAVPQLDAGNGIQPGEYVSVVTLGTFKLIKVDASFGAIQPGDLLTPSPNAGYAMRAGEAMPGTIIGKALDGLETGQGVIAVYVTMQ